MLKPSRSMLAIICGALCANAPSRRKWPSGVVIKKALIAPLRDRWDVKVKNGPDLDVQGDILNHEYTIKEGRKKVAEVSKKWLKLTDTYGVDIDPGQNDILILAIAVAIDMMAHDEDDKKKKIEKRK